MPGPPQTQDHERLKISLKKENSEPDDDEPGAEGGGEGGGEVPGVVLGVFPGRQACTSWPGRPPSPTG